MLVTIVNILVIVVLALYLAKRWNEAKERRDIPDSLRTSVNMNKRSLQSFHSYLNN